MTKPFKVNTLAALSIPIACVIFALKYLAYYVTGSVALYSDALESVVNIVSAIVAWWAISISQKPADKNHPFGHAKAEYFSAIFEGVLIIIAALMILYQAFQAIHGEVHILAQPKAGIAINILSSIINALWAFVLIHIGKKRFSPALEADGRHLSADVFTSVGIIIGLVVALATGWSILDPLIAIIVALQILWQGGKLLYGSAQGLMDASLSSEKTEQICTIISENAAGAIEAHDFRSRQAGHAVFIEFHLVVPAKMTVGNAHAICDRIEKAIHNKFAQAQTLIHVEPENEAKVSPQQSGHNEEHNTFCMIHS